MPTNWPTSIDAPHDPVAGESMASGQAGDLAVEVTNLNDRTVAIENALGTTSGSAGNFGPMRLMARQVIGTAVNSITFSSIPGVFENLYVTYMGAFSDAGVGNAPLGMRFNGDTAANYDFDLLWIEGAFAGNGNGVVATTTMEMGFLSAATAPAGAVGSGTIMVPSYARTTFRKVASSQGMMQAGATVALNYNTVSQGVWHSTAAVTSITLYDFSGGNFVVGSVLSLYGQG